MSQTKKQIRKNFAKVCKERDKGLCRVCGVQTNENPHHITDRNEMPNGGYILENGITLCSDCHFKAECYHRSKGLVWPEGFHPHELYQKINSSYEEAIEKDK